MTMENETNNLRNISSAQELEKIGVNFDLIPLTQSVHSVKDVQEACNCKTAEVIKTLVFVGDTPVIVVLPGDKMANLEKIKKVVGGQSLRMAKLEEVVNLTGFSVGSVSPFGINSEIKQIADNSILNLSSLFLGSGKSDVLIKINQTEFKKAFRGVFASISDLNTTLKRRIV